MSEALEALNAALRTGAIARADYLARRATMDASKAASDAWYIVRQSPAAQHAAKDAAFTRQMAVLDGVIKVLGRMRFPF